ncbi:MAG: YbbR-like domain-containing protein [Muribaculaceae bacterium]|nr:YbbR-like domain-containing protein [Muribaculaceae bacterium]
MDKRLQNIKKKWRKVKASKGFHNAVVFLCFVAVATVFWFILAMNDSVTKTIDVNLRIVNLPDSVTFINDPPKDIHVTLRDKGTNLLRTGIVNHPSVVINFRDFASDSYFRFSKSDLDAALKSTFGSSAQIGSVSIDSLSLRYTTSKGHRVPIVVRADVSASAGYVIDGIPEPLVRVVKVYSVSNNIDTLSRVYTEQIVKRNLSETTVFDVPLVPMTGVKLVPSKVKVRIKVDPLVKKDGMATIRALNVPQGMNLLLFPAVVPVSYYVPMSHFNDENVPVKVTVNYDDVERTPVSRIPLSVTATEDYVASPQVGQPDVEYTLVRE